MFDPKEDLGIEEGLLEMVLEGLIFGFMESMVIYLLIWSGSSLVVFLYLGSSSFDPSRLRRSCLYTS